MAVHLKKRAFAEYSQVIEVDSPKRLKLAKKSKLAAWDLPLITTPVIDSQEALKILSELSESMPTQVEAAQVIYKALVKLLMQTKDPIVCIKILNLLKEIFVLANHDADSLFDELTVLIASPISGQVISQVLEVLHGVATSVSGSVKLRQNVLQLGNKHLLGTNHLVKAKCLRIICDLTPADANPVVILSTLRLLAGCGHDQDPRVRTAAFQAILRLYERGVRIDMNIYNDAIHMLDDDYEGVRIACLRLAVVISQAFSESLVPVPGSHEHIRLIDDAFAKACNAINDLSLVVRTQAAQLLGTMTSVSLRFLAQTLDKRLMSNMRRKCSAHERQKENFRSGEWSSGQKWADDAPREALEAEGVSVITSGACGAMVHGLEDDYLEVRSATLDSLCQLALGSRTFANLSIDFLIDMFNDEIEDIGLQAIHCFTKISHFIILREDQLETILALLEDCSADIREALHSMLSGCQLSTKVCLRMCVEHLLENLSRYPRDERSIWRCLQKLGTKHWELTLPLVTELLSIHPYFDTAEPDMDDPSYVSILILVFNSAVTYPTMIPLFDQHTKRHYSYLRDSLPHLVPHINVLYRGQKSSEISASSKTTAFLQQVLKNVARAEKLNSPTSHRLQETAILDLQRVAQADQSLSAAANCASLYIQCQLLYDKIMRNKNWFSASVLALQHGNTVKNEIEQLLRSSFRLNHLFSGLSSAEVFAVRQMHLKVLALNLVYVVRESNSSALALCVHFLEQLKNLQKFIITGKQGANSFVGAVFRAMVQLEDPKPGMVARMLQPLLQSHHSPALHLSSAVFQAKATIYEPSSESDTARKFTAGLILGVKLDAEIENVANLKSVRVKVKYPDQQCQLILPRFTDFRRMDEHRCRLRTTVLLSHSVWSEACQVEISLALDFSESETGNRMPKTTERAIDLCKPVKVCISPNPITKGI